MLRKINIIIQVLLVASSSLFLYLSFPNHNLEFLAWFAFLPLFFALRRSKRKEAFFLSYLCGFIFFGLTISWLHHVSILGYLLLVANLSLFFGIFGITFLYAIRYMLSAIFVIPAFWVFLEYLRSNLFTGFGWALLGYSQYLNLPFIQISDLAGVYGVSFLIMMVNVVIYDIFCNGVRKALLRVFIGLFVLCGIFSYGYFELKREESVKEVMNITLIQGNIPQELKWDPRHEDRIFKTYKGLTRTAAKDRPYLIIWPETALPGFVEEERYLEDVKILAKDVGAYLLIGAPSLGYSGEGAMFNSAVLISKEGRVIEQHNKLHLVPFGEYIPFGRHINFLRRFIDKPIGDFTAGKEYTVFELDNGLRYGVLICFEDIFSNLTRRFVLRDADFMVNITNDAWFMKTSAPYQHAQSSVFRAVENRVPLVRAANTGFSCFIDRYGRITDSLKVDGEEIFVAGYKTKKINFIEGKTSFYSKFGDLFVFLCVITLVISGGMRSSRRYSQF